MATVFIDQLVTAVGIPGLILIGALILIILLILSRMRSSASKGEATAVAARLREALDLAKSRGIEVADPGIGRLEKKIKAGKISEAAGMTRAMQEKIGQVLVGYIEAEAEKLMQFVGSAQDQADAAGGETAQYLGQFSDHLYGAYFEPIRDLCGNKSTGQMPDFNKAFDLLDKARAEIDNNQALQDENN